MKTDMQLSIITKDTKKDFRYMQTDNVPHLKTSYKRKNLPRQLEAGKIKMKYLKTDKWYTKAKQPTRRRLIQSLNSPFFPPPIGAEPGRAKRESRITCMRMLRTNQSKIIRVHTPLLASMCRAMLFSARALKRKNTFSLTLILW